jgi:hypothetical protein
MDTRLHDLAPRARNERLIVRELADEVLIYDLNRQQAHCLNRTASLVWKNCDGETTVDELVQLLSRELGAPVDEQVVWLALGQLATDHLLESKLDRPKGVTRRQALKLGMAVATIPVIASLAAPSAFAALSGACSPCAGGCIPHSCNGCNVDSDCCGGVDCHGGGHPGGEPCCKHVGSVSVCGNLNSHGDCG